MNDVRVVALTGATGFVGGATLDAALANGLQVRALTRGMAKDRDRVEWVRGTLDDTGALDALCQGADAVIHIAGLTNTHDPSRFARANVTGTANLLAAAKAAGAEALAAGTVPDLMPGSVTRGAAAVGRRVQKRTRHACPLCAAHLCGA